jgi:phage protein U
MYCQLGDILFEGLKGFEAWSVEGNEASYGEHALIDGKPRLQKTGDTLQELNLTFRLHAKFCNPKQELAKLDKAKTEGEILPLLMGDGTYVSDYVIISAPYTVDHALADGTIVQATVNLSLKEYIPYSKEEQQQQAARKNAFATDDKKPVVTRPPQPPTAAAAAAKNVTETAQQANKVDGLVSEYENNLSSQATIEQSIKDACDKGNKAINDLNDKLNNAQSLQNIYTGLQGAAQSVSGRFSSIKALFPITNIADLKDANTYLQAAMRSMYGASIPLFNNVITRR